MRWSSGNTIVAAGSTVQGTSAHSTPVQTTSEWVRKNKSSNPCCLSHKKENRAEDAYSDPAAITRHGCDFDQTGAEYQQLLRKIQANIRWIRVVHRICFYCTSPSNPFEAIFAVTSIPMYPPPATRNHTLHQNKSRTSMANIAIDEEVCTYHNHCLAILLGIPHGFDQPVSILHVTEVEDAIQVSIFDPK